MRGLASIASLVLAISPVSGPAWRGVITDWLDNNRLDRPHTCAALAVATTRLSAMSMPAGYSRIFAGLKAETHRVCPRPTLDRGKDETRRKPMQSGKAAATSGVS